MKRGNIIRKT